MGALLPPHNSIILWFMIKEGRVRQIQPP